MEYTFFWKSKLSQWAFSSFKDEVGIKYTHAEQYMMYQKALLFGDKETAEFILKEDDPSEQQKLGRNIKNFNQNLWDKSKTDIVYRGNYLKYTQNPELKKMLFNTGDTTLVEASPYDKIWGVGLGADNTLIKDPKNWRGQNLLGYTLTKVRDDLRKVDDGKN